MFLRRHQLKSNSGVVNEKGEEFVGEIALYEI